MRDNRLSSGPLAQRITREIEAAGNPIIKGIVRLLIDRFEDKTTLLGVCPNSKAVARAALLAAGEANAPLLLAATLNQVDVDGGYTGWTPKGLIDFLADEAERIGLDTPILTCLDHGGPWLKDLHMLERYSYREAIQAVKRSIEACIDAGYALLHIDPTVDPTLAPDEPISIRVVAERTLELIDYAETYRRSRGRSPISYEVGTEEVHGGLANMENFETFLETLDRGMHERGIEDAWPAFVVGKVGTDLHTSYFDPTIAQRLTDHVRPFGALIKGHYTDYVDNPEDYPRSGMGGANVGPEFTEEEYKALMDLVALERKIGVDSGMEDAMRDAVVQSGRWKKWLQQDEQGFDFNELEETRQSWLVRTGCRYIWTASAVINARCRLYENLKGYCDADAYLIWRIKTAILRYYHHFNLIGFNERALKELALHSL